MPARPVPARPPTDGELAFLSEYLVDRNATRAYLAVHPRANRVTARTEASKTLAKPYIRTRLKRMQAEAGRKAKVDAERVLRELAMVAFSDVGDVIDFRTMTLRKRMPPEVRRAIASIRVKVTTKDGPKGKVTKTVIEVRFHSKADALDKLSRHLGLYRELPPLETVLALFPPKLAKVVRAELAAVSLPVLGNRSP